ncbi:MAG: heterocyst frequency control protein PatD [Leptolyngbya sp. SIO4C1]|nr:heterocyst frequency control protein PatD [Leptolyngbya sp. SIO4C1]
MSLSQSSLKMTIQTFNQQAEQLQTGLKSGEMAPETVQSALPELQAKFQPILTAQVDSGQWRSAITEMNRLLRLLQIDLQFLRTATQPDTQQQRRQQSLQHLAQLQALGQGLLTLAA